jgi:hypothetical protein
MRGRANDSQHGEKMTDIKSKNRSHNALIHGVYAKDILMPWESREEFEKLHRDLQTEFTPLGRSEEDCILDLAYLYWRKQSLWRLWHTTILKDPFINDILETNRKSWSGIRKRLRAAAYGHRTLLGELEAKHANMVSRLGSLIKSMDTATDSQEIKLNQDKMRAFLAVINEHVVPLIQTLMHLPNAEQSFDAANAAKKLEELLRLENMIDARIAKVLARLVALKEFKRTPAGGAPTKALTSSQIGM